MEAAGIKEEEATLIDHLASVAALQSRQAGMEVEMLVDIRFQLG